MSANISLKLTHYRHYSHGYYNDSDMNNKRIFKEFLELLINDTKETLVHCIPVYDEEEAMNCHPKVGHFGGGKPIVKPTSGGSVLLFTQHSSSLRSRN